jgi:hypothetical protein
VYLLSALGRTERAAVFHRLDGTCGLLDEYRQVRCPQVEPGIRTPEIENALFIELALRVFSNVAAGARPAADRS